MKEQIKAYARNLKIEYTGIAPADAMPELGSYLEERQAKYGGLPMTNADMETRINPAKTMPEAKSIIVCLFPYANGGGGAKNVSKYARIPDYHRVAGAYLRKICDFIREKEPNCRLMPFADNGPLVDKYLAYRAGLGFFGKNTLLINETYGSFCFIGYIITDLPLQADTPLERTCQNCGACMEHCPGKALGENFDFCVQNCVSYITQTKTINEDQRHILDSQPYIYGCDLCQDVCPHNRNVPKTPIPEFSVPTLQHLEKNDIELLSGREFKQKYASYPFSWCGKGAVLKNFGK